ncbi:MAG: Hsp70 family protein [Candidatus Hodgkinia cicadicola]
MTKLTRSQVSVMILSKMKMTAEVYLNENDKVVITVLAYSKLVHNGKPWKMRNKLRN